MFIALDLETSWIDNKKDKIIEIAIVKFDDNSWEIIDTFSTLINPQIEISDFIYNLTNISNEDLKTRPILDIEIIKKISDFIWDLPIIWHNVSFDIWFLSNYISFEKNIFIDTFYLANFSIIEQKSLNLWSLIDYFWLWSFNEHRALSDTLSTVKLFIKLKQNILNLSINQKQPLKYIFSKSQDKSIVFLKDYLFWDIQNIDYIKYIEILLHQIKKYDELDFKNQIYTNENIDFSKEEIENKFNSFSKIEKRDNQLKLSFQIWENLQKKDKYIIEAPTWVWKTFAYLIPSILYSIKNNQKVFISTKTKILQDQIYFKDLEYLKNNLNLDFSYFKLKWINNYLWVYSFLSYILNNNDFDINQIFCISKITNWIFKTKYWELEELNFYPQENYILKEITSDNEFTLSKENDYLYYEYTYKARTISLNSNIVIINHNILINESISNFRLFWQIENLIIDESHNLEDITTETLKTKFTIDDLNKVFFNIKKYILKNKINLDNIDIYFENMLSTTSLIFDLLSDYTTHKSNYQNDNQEILIQKDFFIQYDIQNIFNKTLQDINHINFIFSNNEEKLLKIQKYISLLNDYFTVIKNTLDIENYDKYIPIFWFNKNWNNYLSYTMLNISNFLQNFLWSKIDSITLLSATFRIWDSFSYIKNSLWLQDFKDTFVETDFDYSSQVLIVSPQDLWTIKYDNPYINSFLLNFLKIVKWNTLILTTSFSSIKNFFIYLKQELSKENISLLAQNIWASKTKIIHFFTSSPNNSVIIWTDSFWEWIDIPWQDLKYLIMHKFPFLNPQDPVFLARSRFYKDPFLEYSIPKTIIKTKQWFWRLIRTKNDKWIFIILDDRLFTTKWWKDMYLSFPKDSKIKHISSQSFLDLIKEKINS